MLNLQHCQLTGTPVAWNAGARLDHLDGALAGEFATLPDAGGNCREIACRDGIPAEFTCPEKPEAYAVRIRDGKIEIFSRDVEGRRHGVRTVAALLRRGALREGTIVDYPELALRAVKLYLPAAEKLAEFKALIDFAAQLKYNAVMLELGGAMEYRRHPEINVGWVEYCRFMNEYPGKTRDIQESVSWEKNSIHSENGGGNWLPQTVIRELADYCRARGMAVIPEVPSLSHCDYLLTAHPELAERADDPWPDTCCPSNPATHKLLFDVLDEVIELFQPEVINVGHDEFYTMSRCPRCRGKSAMLLYAGDIEAIRRRLAERGIRTMIWGEKLLNAYFKDGTPIGGSRKEPDRPGATVSECQEAIYPAIDLVDRSVEILHWYWSIDRDLEQAYFKRGLRVVFGNFSGPAIVDWKRRHQSVDGLVISNWGTADRVTLQRNGIFFELMYASALAWNARLDSGDYPEIRNWTLRELYAMECAAIPETHRLEILHSTDFYKPFHYFFDGHYYSDAEFLLGRYRIVFDDGSTFMVPVAYGGNIGNDRLSPERRIDARSDCYEFDRHFAGVSGAALPEFGEKTRFRHTVALPRERGAIQSVSFEPEPLLGPATVEFSLS